MSGSGPEIRNDTIPHWENLGAGILIFISFSDQPACLTNLFPKIVDHYAFVAIPAYFGRVDKILPGLM
jgi:hypothetical protein